MCGSWVCGVYTLVSCIYIYCVLIKKGNGRDPIVSKPVGSQGVQIDVTQIN